MTSLDALLRAVTGLHPQDVQRWVALAWVTPEGAPGTWQFRDIDVARVQLIATLHTELAIGEDAMPTVLMLLDQLYDTRRALRQVAGALPDDVLQRLLTQDDGG